MARALRTRFDTVEINNTFYRLPPASTVERWAAAGAAGLLYALKLGHSARIA